MHPLALRARLFAALGMTAMTSAQACRRAPEGGPLTASPGDSQTRLESGRDAAVATADAARTAQPPIDPAVLARIGWRAVDGGYIHTVTQARPPEIVRARAEPGVYAYREMFGQVQVEVFTTEPPPQELVGTTGLSHDLSGMGCGPPDVRCFEGRATAPGEAAAARAASCAASRRLSARSGQAGLLNLDITQRERRTHRGDVCCYTWRRFCGGGRLLRRDGVAVRAPWVAQDAPVDRALEAALREALGDADDRATLAARWAQEASFEHGSVRSFDEALAALEALAAPGDIVAETRRARDDEVGHAQALFGLASALAGVALGPGPLALAPAAIPSRTEFARALFVEACVNETLAVSQAQAALADPAIVPPIAAILAPIVQDECAHVELAWRTLAWCLRSGDEAVYAAVADELAAFESTLEVAGAPWDDLSPSLGSRGGLLPLRARNRVRALSAREIIVPCARALLERVPDDAHIPRRASV